MKFIVLLAILAPLMFGTDIKEPRASFTSSGGVVDIIYQDGKLYSATDAGSIDIFDFKSRVILEKIEVPKIKDFMGEEIDSKVYSVDKIKAKIMILSQDKEGFRRIHLYHDGKMELLIDSSEALAIAKAKFLDENTVLLALLSDELISYDIKKRTNNWMVQVSGAKFSDFVLNESKSEVVVADESGNIKIHSTKDGKLLKTLAGENLDNVFQVDYKGGVIATAGQDRRVVIYVPKAGSAYQVKSSFLVYSVGLSPSGAIVGYSSDENNNVTLLETASKSKIALFGKNRMTISKIVFINENEFLVASDDKIINLYSVK
ncbi:MAG: hypothetical protein QG565_619 [Campylobacterota bacterium]|nr:hypothetical protein [Campylobacterota bacterium]MDQ1267367.1 hypothetical protein [Campylobacterota bacterium]MDQ1337091.1 hypothetical protein [Campylobacterota bacterium]